MVHPHQKHFYIFDLKSIELLVLILCITFFSLGYITGILIEANKPELTIEQIIQQETDQGISENNQISKLQVIFSTPLPLACSTKGVHLT